MTINDLLQMNKTGGFTDLVDIVENELQDFLANGENLPKEEFYGIMATLTLAAEHPEIFQKKSIKDL